MLVSRPSNDEEVGSWRFVFSGRIRASSAVSMLRCRWGGSGYPAAPNVRCDGCDCPEWSSFPVVRVRPGVGVGAVAALVLLGLGVLAEWPTTDAGYRRTATTSAQQTLSAAGTAVLLANSADDLPGPYLTVGMTTARTDITAAGSALLDTDVPSDTARGIRDQLAPLITATATTVGDLMTANRHRRRSRWGS